MEYKYTIASAFSSGTEYEIFRDNYCDNGCVFHKENKDGFAEFAENGGCPIEDRCENARFYGNAFPNVLLKIWKDGVCLKFHHCPFYTKQEEVKNE